MIDIRKHIKTLEESIEETPDRFLFLMVVLLIIFSEALERPQLAQEMGGLTIAAIIVNTFYSFDVIKKELNKTFAQILIISAALGGLFTFEFLQRIVVQQLGEIFVVQIVGGVVLLSRLAVHFPESFTGSADNPSVQTESRAMYGFAIASIVLPVVPNILTISLPSTLVNWITIIAACLIFMSIYRYE